MRTTFVAFVVIVISLTPTLRAQEGRGISGDP